MTKLRFTDNTHTAPISQSETEKEQLEIKKGAGWVKLYRCVLDTDLEEHPLAFGIFTLLLLRASRKPRRFYFDGLPIDFPEGSVSISVRDTAKSWGVHKNTLTRVLKYLVCRGTITQKTGHEGTILTVCNYSKYQTDPIDGGPPRDHDGTTECPGPPPNKKLRIKKEELRTRNNSSLSVSEYPEWFESAYAEYPKKVGKQKGWLSVKRSVRTEGDQNRFAKAVRVYRDSVKGTELRYVKGFDSFAGQWMDWADLTAPKDALDEWYEEKLKEEQEKQNASR